MSFIGKRIRAKSNKDGNLSAILDRQGLQVTAPVDLRTKKAGNFTPLLLQGLFVQAEEKSQDRCDVSDCCYEEHKQQEVIWQQYHLCLAVAGRQIFGGKHFLILVTRNRKNLVVEEGTIPPEKSTAAMDLPARQVT